MVDFNKILNIELIPKEDDSWINLNFEPLIEGLNNMIYDQFKFNSQVDDIKTNCTMMHKCMDDSLITCRIIKGI